jgi:hypothetical protein
VKVACVVQDGTAVMGDIKEEPVIPTVPFSACLNSFAAEAIISDVDSAAAGAKVQGKQMQRFKTFPPYLMVHLQKCVTAFAIHPLIHTLLLPWYIFLGCSYATGTRRSSKHVP